MFAFILAGASALMVVLLSSAFFMFAHLTGRVRRSTALSVTALALIIGAALAGIGTMDGPVLGPMAVPIGVFLMIAAGINGFVAYQAPRSAKLR